jgi:hypothetical protein
MALVKAGQHLCSRVCTTEVIVVKAPSIDVVIACGGEPMAAKNEAISPPAGSPSSGGPGTLLGKRYSDDELGLELLCVKAGGGQLSVNGGLLQMGQARALPASD